ncbi:MAG TPA: hypothetical protein P5279_13110 [Anaerohalosphaeraceae bacterium]|jgi:hypothetical protein|nr:hypothetical protein [Anaerohalosphaeraceae bacterium]
MQKVWQHWFKVGGERVRQQLESQYTSWKESKEGPLRADESNKRWAMSKAGIAALPFLVEKVIAGDTELIEQISVLTQGEVNKDASSEDVR